MRGSSTPVIVALIASISMVALVAILAGLFAVTQQGPLVINGVPNDTPSKTTVFERRELSDTRVNNDRVHRTDNEPEVITQK